MPADWNRLEAKVGELLGAVASLRADGKRLSSENEDLRRRLARYESERESLRGQLDGVLADLKSLEESSGG
ncbi:MAG: hypothetical protein AB1405_09285 [Bdellovibrionota bacterium]